jgi:hypothetical protein
MGKAWSRLHQHLLLLLLLLLSFRILKVVIIIFYQVPFRNLIYVGILIICAQ